MAKETEVRHSKNFEKVKDCYDAHLETGVGWSKERVCAAVGKWITAAEYEEITGAVYAA